MDLVQHVFLSMGMRSKDELRVAIAGMGDSIKSMPNTGRTEDCPVRNWFAPGVYCREITMPEGMLIEGRIHRHAHLNILSKGKCVVLTEDGYAELTAPCTFVSEVGTKRLVYCLEDVVWTTVHDNPDDCRDVRRIVERITTDNYNDIELRG